MPHKKGFIDLLNVVVDTREPMRGIEIGFWEGEFCKELLDNFPNLTMLTIDPSPRWESLNIPLNYFNKRLQIFHMESDEAQRVIEGKFDFVFIDGDHSYQQCKKDILNYWKFVRPGGLLAGHNYHDSPDSAHLGVHQAVKEIFGDKHRLQPDFIWYVQI